jgi:hypothetical protein
VAARARGEHIQTGGCPNDHVVTVRGAEADDAGPFGDLVELKRAREAARSHDDILSIMRDRYFLRDMTMSGGNGAGDMAEALAGVEMPPFTPVDWRKALRNLIGSMRKPSYSYSRPNRRAPHRIGEIPGRVYARSTDSRPHVLAAIDTSASMPRHALDEIARQMRTLDRHVRITVVECDQQIGRIYPFDRRISDIEGRGGTDLRPVFEPEFLRKHAPAAVVYFTDGDGPYPSEAPRLRTLWLLTRQRADFDCPWGDRAYMEVPPGARDVMLPQSV